MGDLPQFADLVERHQSMVYSIALRCLGQREAAEDLTQEVFLSLHQNLHSIENEDHVRNWLRRTAANRSIDEIRRRRYRGGPALEEVPEASVEAGDSDPLLLSLLRSTVAALPAEARVLTVLRFQQDWEPREIAAALNIPVATVKSRIHRTLKLLRGKLERCAEVRLKP
jgi:RNA polymerase sigma-70 factor (ECF subfamily)